MNSSELEIWAVKMAARNTNPVTWAAPVLLYRNGEASLLGAFINDDDGGYIVTAAHGFSVVYPAYQWSYRKLIPTSEPVRPIVKAVPLDGFESDVAICTPASVLQLASDPLPNFYSRRDRVSQATLNRKAITPVTGSAISTLTGKRIPLVGLLTFDGAEHILLNLKSDGGRSGSVFIDEHEKYMYLLRAYIPEWGASIAIRLRVTME